MKEKIISYNVNGIRSAATKGLLEYLKVEKPDVVMFQEIKATPEDLPPGLLNPDGYHAYWFPAQKKGYSGVAIWSRRKPEHVEYGCGMDRYDAEGRVIRLDFPEYSVMDIYFPSGTTGEERQGFKDVFLEDMMAYFRKISKKYPKLVLSGDYNIAHTEKDIHNPVSNKDSSGFLPHERAWMTKLFSSGFKDSFRMFHPDKQEYSWWTFRANARANNKGWRIDYHVVTDAMAKHCTGAAIHPDARHSDHCPISLMVEF